MANRQRWLALSAVLLGTFFGTFNNSAATVALVDVLDEFPVGVAAGVWFVTSYLLAFAVTMPLAGRLADAFGTRRVYLAGLAGFLASSIGVALAPSYPWLVALRTLQGLFNAPVLPTVMVTALALAPPDAAGRAMGAWAAVNGAAIALGPPLGGVLTGTFGWRSVFWVQVPLLALVIAASAAYVPDVPPTRRRARLDLAGAALLSGGLVGLMLGVSRIPTSGWGSPVVWGSVAAGLALLTGFASWSRRREDSLVDLRLLASPAYATLSAVAGLQMAVLYGLLFALPLALVHVFGYSTSAAGAVVFVLPGAMVLGAPVLGWAADRHPVRLVTAAGGAALVVGATLVAGGAMLGMVWGMVTGMAVIGLGVAAIQTPTTAAVALAVADDSRGAALGVFHTIRFLAGAVGGTLCAVALEALAGSGRFEDVAAARLRSAFAGAFVLMAAAAVVVVVTARSLPAQPLRMTSHV